MLKYQANLLQSGGGSSNPATFKLVLLSTIVYGWRRLAIVAKKSILDVTGFLNLSLTMNNRDVKTFAVSLAFYLKYSKTSKLVSLLGITLLYLSHFITPVTLCNNFLSHFVMPITLCNNFLSHFILPVALCITCYTL